MIGFKVSQELKEILQRAAQAERRSLSNFIINALLEYLRERHGTEHTE